MIPTEQLPGGVSKQLLDALQLAQKNLKSRLDTIDERTHELSRSVHNRRLVGIGLKCTTVLAGILIAAGVLPEAANQAAGIAVLAVVALERVFANLDLLMTNTAARDAYERVRRQVENAHEAGIVPLVAIRDSQPEEFARKLIDLSEKLRSQLSKAEENVETGIDNRNYELLGRLSLEDESKKE